VVTFAGIIGTIARYALPGRTLHGLAVLPALGVIIGSLTWSIAMWTGLAANSVWPWIISLGVTTAGVIAFAIVLPKRRTAQDQAQWAELTHARS